MRVLIVEDEKAILSALQKGFQKKGYAVDTASDGEAALECYYANYYDLIMLDLNLPKIDGMEVLTRIRKEDKEIKILILSARGQVEDRIEGLDLGANDYLTKPFHFEELDARVRALLRRKFNVEDTTVVCGDIAVDTALKKTYRRGEEIQLTKKEYGILEYLMLHKKTVVSGEELIEHIWDSEVDSFTNSFKVHISGLRKKLPEGFIGNVRGQGYYVE